MLEEASEKCLPKKKDFLNREDPEEKEKDGAPKKSKNCIPKVVRMLMKKKQKLSQKILKSKSWEKNYSVMLELQEIEDKLSGHYNERRRKEEKEAIQKLKHNPKYFYSYQKRFSKTVNTIGDFVNKTGDIITDPMKKAEMLKDQYDSVASEPNKDFIVNNAEDFFPVRESSEENEEDQNSIELLLVDDEEDMPPLSLQEEETTDNEEEDEEENEEDLDKNTNSSEYNYDDNEEDEKDKDVDTAPSLCHQCSLETVHECGEDRYVWSEEDEEENDEDNDDNAHST